MKVWILLFAALPLCAQTESESWNLFYQATLIGQYHGTFRSPYSGSNSLRDYAERDVSLTSTLLGFRLGPNTTFYFDPEIAGGGRFSNEKLMELSLLEFLLRLGAALLMGAAVGLERQWRQRMAGMRTTALVAAGASAFVMCAFMVRDTSRSEAQIVSYVVSGVGFLGAGVIFKDAGGVRGLNTAATIWCSAAIGAISGLGQPLHALILAAAVLSTNVFCGRLPTAFIRRNRPVGSRKSLTHSN